MKKAPEQQVDLKGTVFFLAVGLFPLLMFLQFWLRSGTGLHPTLWGFMALYGASFLVALNYFLFYRQYRPRSALVPPGPFKALFVGALLIGFGTFNMMATGAGLGLTLSPGPRIESKQMVPTMAKVLLMKPVKVPPRQRLDLRNEGSWLLAWPYQKGSLWGALGYAVAFGLAGMLFGFLRKELVDPRDEHLGSGMMGGVVRGMVGLYYGATMGFLVGATLVIVVRFFFPNYAAVPPAILHWVYVLGAATNPNTAFTYAFSTAGLMVGAMSLFMGRRDFTASVSDPKAPELTRPLNITVPPVPEPPPVAFDARQMQGESQQILANFASELSRLTQGPQWEYERYELPEVGKPGKKAEAPVTNLVSSRLADEDAEFSAMGSLSNVYVQITANLGTLNVSAADWLALAEGAMLELPKAKDGAIRFAINGVEAGRGRAMTVNGYKAVKVTHMAQSVQSLVQP